MKENISEARLEFFSRCVCEKTHCLGPLVYVLIARRSRHNYIGTASSWSSSVFRQNKQPSSSCGRSSHPGQPSSCALRTQPTLREKQYTLRELELELESAHNTYLYVQALEICIGSPRRVQDTELEYVRPNGKSDFNLISLPAGHIGPLVHNTFFDVKEKDLLQREHLRGPQGGPAAILGIQERLRHSQLYLI